MSDSIRRHSVAVKVGGVKVGGGNPIVVQSMTNTDTVDVDATAAQVEELMRASSLLVRIMVNARSGGGTAHPKQLGKLRASRNL